MNAPVDIRPQDLVIVQSILRDHAPDARVWVFGSRAKWTTRESSDLDLALDLGRAMTLSEEAALRSAFEESDLPYKVDIVDRQTATPSFQAVIDRDGVKFNQVKQWEPMTLGKAGVRLIDCVHATPQPAIVGYPYIAIPEMKDGRLDFDSARKITVEDFKAWTRKAHPRKHDVVLSRRTNPGVTAPVSDHSDFALGQNLVLLRADGERVAPEFLRWLVSSPQWWTQIQKFMNVGAVFNSLKCADVPNFELPIPPKEEQRAIASTLAALDDKIELNRRMNATLERQAQAVFRDWFVDFGPVRRKQAGEADPVAIMGGLTPDPTHATHLAALFPDALGDDALPVGWAMTPFSSVVTIIGGGTPKTSIATYWDGDIPWFSVADTPAGADTFVLDTEKRITRAGLENSSARMIPAGTTIITARGTVGNLAVAGREMTFNQSCYALRSADGERPYFVYLATSRAIEQLQSMAHGSVFSTITRQTFDSVPIAKAGYEMIEMFEQIVTPLFERIKANAVENRTLAETRDYLLPRLMSGTVRVVPQDRAA